MHTYLISISFFLNLTAVLICLLWIQKQEEMHGNLISCFLLGKLIEKWPQRMKG